MKPDELKLRISEYSSNLIDDIFPSTNLFGKLKNATAKFWINQNLWKLDMILNQFIDKEGEINTKEAYDIYSNELFDANGKFTLDLQSIIDNETLCKYFPNSIVIFTKDDLNNILNIPPPDDETDSCDVE